MHLLIPDSHMQVHIMAVPCATGRAVDDRVLRLLRTTRSAVLLYRGAPQ